jgi:hypothetical protein
MIGVVTETPSPAISWLLQWRAAGPALEEIRRRELRELSDEQALVASEALLSMAASVPLPPERVGSSGLVAQQALFHRHGPR